MFSLLIAHVILEGYLYLYIEKSIRKWRFDRFYLCKAFICRAFFAKTFNGYPSQKFGKDLNTLLNALLLIYGPYYLLQKPPTEIFWEKGILKYFGKFSGKQLCESCRPQAWNFIEKETWVFSCEIWKIFKKSFFTEHLPPLFLSLDISMSFLY